MPTWNDILARNPEHSENYALRWKTLEAEGTDIYGEARTIDAMAQRGSRILDAGCGTGRIGGYLAACGHEVIGVDLDPTLIRHARTDYPNVRWEVGDLTANEIPGEDYDLIVCAGNVFTFLPEEGRRPALKALRGVLADNGRAVIGFGAGRGYEFDDFFADAQTAGFVEQCRWESWNLEPWQPTSSFIVAVLSSGLNRTTELNLRARLNTLKPGRDPH